MRPCHGTLKVSVRLGNGVDAGEDGRGLGAAIENEDRRLAIAPGRVAEELVDCFAERRRPLPELALGNEDVAVALPQKDVGLTSHVEGLARRLSLKLAVELHKEVLPQGFLVHGLEGIGAALHHERHVLNHFQKCARTIPWRAPVPA